MLYHNVSVGIIFNQNKNSIYLTKRRQKDHLNNYWEFPGGKIEKDETPTAALLRELYEEIGIKVSVSLLLHINTFKYSDRIIKINFFLIKKYTGKIFPKENQEIKLFSVKNLNSVKYPKANSKIINFLSKNHELIDSCNKIFIN